MEVRLLSKYLTLLHYDLLVFFKMCWYVPSRMFSVCEMSSHLHKYLQNRIINKGFISIIFKT